MIELRQRGGRGYVELGQHDSDDDVTNDLPDWGVGFRKSSRERLLRSLSPIRRTVEEVGNHPAAPACYRLIFGFSLTGVIFLGTVGNLLLNDTPYIRVSSHAKYDKPGLGRVAVEAAIMYFFLMCISGLAWYRRARNPCPPPSRVVARPNTPSVHSFSHRPSGSFI